MRKCVPNGAALSVFYPATEKNTTSDFCEAQLFLNKNLKRFVVIYCDRFYFRCKWSERILKINVWNVWTIPHFFYSIRSFPCVDVSCSLLFVVMCFEWVEKNWVDNLIEIFSALTPINGFISFDCVGDQ